MGKGGGGRGGRARAEAEEDSEKEKEGNTIGMFTPERRRVPFPAQGLLSMCARPPKVHRPRQDPGR